MLSILDDYCVHQSPDPIRQPATSDENAYDNYFANGFHINGDYYLAMSFGRLANRGVMYGAVTVQTGGVHHSFFASGDDPDDPTETKLAELELKIEDPMRTMTISLDDNDSGMSCFLRWHARSAPLEEKRSTLRSKGRLIIDLTRWTQFGCWEGWFEIDGVRTEVLAEQCLGVKDRSWGIRTIGNSGSDDSSQKRPLFWNWVPLNFGDFCIHSHRLETPETTAQECIIAPLYENEKAIPINEKNTEQIDSWSHNYVVSKETRRIVGGEIELDRSSGQSSGAKIEIGEPLMTAWTYSIGYSHPKWNHGSRHGKLATGHERWNVADVDPTDDRFAIMHQIVKVKYDGREGFGFVEQSITGPYPRYGLSD